MAEKKRPGVMFYFETRPSLKRLSLEEKGLLLEGILDYAEHGELPQFEGMLGVAWDFIQPRLDRDKERYEEVTEARRKAAQKRWEEQETQEDAVQMDANASFAMQTMPTTTSISTTTTTPTSTSTPTPAAKRIKSSEMIWEDLRRAKIKQFTSLMPSDQVGSLHPPDS